MVNLFIVLIFIIVGLIVTLLTTLQKLNMEKSKNHATKKNIKDFFWSYVHQQEKCNVPLRELVAYAYPNYELTRKVVIDSVQDRMRRS